jgi:DNA-binding protein YbaB
VDEVTQAATAGLTNPLERAISLLSKAAPGSTVGTGIRGAGTGGEGRVHAEVSGYGRLETLTIDPGLIRAGTAAIAEYVQEAVRAAQDDAARQSAEQLRSATDGLDPDAMAERLGRISLEASQGVDRMLSALNTVADRLNRS